MNEKWIEALRSGDYAQGCNALGEGGRHCCLGVLMGVEEGPGGWYMDQLTANVRAGDRYVTTTSTLDNEWFTTTTGLRSDAMEALMVINDTGGTFAQIADALEAVDPTRAITDLADEICGNNY